MRAAECPECGRMIEPDESRPGWYRWHKDPHGWGCCRFRAVVREGPRPPEFIIKRWTEQQVDRRPPLRSLFRRRWGWRV